MLFDINVQQDQCPLIWAKGIQLITPSLLNKCEASFARGIQQNPFIEHYFDSHFAIERTLLRLRDYRRATNRLPDLMHETDLRLHRAFAFLAMLVKAHEHMTEQEQTAFIARIRQGMTSPAGLSPLAHELHTVSQLMKNDFDVAWHDLTCPSQSQRRFDFIARKGDLEIEVECKAFSTDIGRKIHLPKQFDLAGKIHNAIAAAVAQRGSIFLHIDLPDRLKGSQIDAIAGIVRRTLDQFTGTDDPSVCSVTPYNLDIQTSPFLDMSRSNEPSQEVVHDYILNSYGVDTRRYMYLVKPNAGVAVVGFTSRQPDDVADSVYKQLKEGANQLSETRPGMICASFLDMTPKHLEDLATSRTRTPLNSILDRFYINPSRSHVHTVEFTTLGVVGLRSYELLATRHSLVGISTPSYRTTNNRHPLANDNRLRIS